MDIEELTKTQLLMLTILVNFIVSIATGVLVISMLDQSPTPITQTVQQIVDNTIETISTPITSPIVITKPSPTPAATPTQEQMLTAAITADGARTVLIHKNSTTSPALAFGVYLSKSRAVATSATGPLPKEAVIEFADGSSAPASISKQSSGITIYGFADDAALPVAPAANPVKAADLKQGQSVVALTKDRAAITGIVSKVDATGITTSLAGIPAGAAAVDLSGNIIGIAAPSGILFTTDSIMALLESPAGKP